MREMPQSDWWGETRKRLADDYAKLSHDEFKNWPSVRSIPLYSHLEDQWQAQWDAVSRLASLGPEWPGIIRRGESLHGHTDESRDAAARRVTLGGAEMSTTPWYVQALHHALVFESVTRRPIWSYKRYVEIGAGIGELAKLVLDNCDGAEYFIYDFPETAAISNLYLEGRARYVESTSEVDVVPGDTLLVATWSLSECPVEDRATLLEPLRGADALVAFQTDIWGYDNMDYFAWDFPKELDAYVRFRPHIPDYRYSQGTNVYCFGKTSVAPSAGS